MPIDRADFAACLRELRQRDRLTIANAAARARVSERQWTRWEQRAADPSYASIEKIARAFRVPAETLTGGVGLEPAAPATRADLARLERKLDELRAHLGVPDA